MAKHRRPEAKMVAKVLPEDELLDNTGPGTGLRRRRTDPHLDTSPQAVADAEAVDRAFGDEP